MFVVPFAAGSPRCSGFPCTSLPTALQGTWGFLFQKTSTNKLTYYAIGVEKWVKKVALVFCSLYPKLCSVLIPVSIWQQCSVDKHFFQRNSFQTQHAWGFSAPKYSGVFHSFKIHLLLYCFHVSYKISQGHNKKIILLSVLKLSHTSFLIIKVAFSAKTYWTDKN